MKILVTGGAGFIASHVVDAYVKAGHRVVVVDNLATGSRKNLNPKARFYKADIRDAKKIDEVFKKERPDAVNHHAAIAVVVESLRNPLPTLDVNVTGTINLLLAGGKYKVKKFIFASTGGAMYGNFKTIPASETAEPMPLSPYGLSKRLGELAIAFYAEMYGFDYFIFRYANVYGPRQNPNGEAGVVAIFGKLMRMGKQPIIYGDGTKTRDYVFVEDIARANLLALKKGHEEIVNIGWGKEVSDKKIFETIAHYAGYRGKPKYAPYRKGELYRSAITNTKANKTLGWKPKVKFEEGVRRTLETL